MHPHGEDGWHTAIPTADEPWDPARFPLWVPRDQGEDGMPRLPDDNEFENDFGFMDWGNVDWDRIDEQGQVLRVDDANNEEDLADCENM